MAGENQVKQENKSPRKHKVLFAFIVLVLVLGLSFFTIFKTKKDSEIILKVVNEKIDNTSPRTDSYFKNADPIVYQLARKIEKKEPITLEDVKILPDGTLNARYDNDITLLFLALTARNLQAIDVLLAAGADPYMVDRPSYGSENDFTYYTATVTMVKPDYSFDPEVTKKFRYELTEIYLKNGGKADHIIPGENPLSLLFMHALKRNYDAVKLLIDQGADPLWIGSLGHSTIMSLATEYDEESRKLLKYIVCKGYYKNATYEQVNEAIKWFAPSGPKNIAREHDLKQLSMLILKENPDFKDNRYTEEAFAGPIPWQEIRDMKISEVCHD
ncbi:hypothetical protein [Bartonella sp. HY761]|uniref:hypothetical protein n=1 Tax=Bartonella sp. HY761 TaxID=2979330 RepID=UPI002203A9FF|nr:hypothetical protein [Bartonella sp. HY761]UXN05193.1 hypothetical protein N6A79_07625 [Bartonella sp. HY761]